MLLPQLRGEVSLPKLPFGDLRSANITSLAYEAHARDISRIRILHHRKLFKDLSRQLFRDVEDRRPAVDLLDTDTRATRGCRALLVSGEVESIIEQPRLSAWPLLVLHLFRSEERLSPIPELVLFDLLSDDQLFVQELEVGVLV